jgi:hypothetical protein
MKREELTSRSDDEKADKRQKSQEEPDADGSEDDEEQDSEGGAFSDSSNEQTFSNARDRLEAILRQGQESEEDDGSEDSSDDSEDSSSNEFAIRVSLINGACGQYFHAAEVKGTHRTICDDCGEIPSYGYYAVDHPHGVYDAPKLCEECVRYRSKLLFEAATVDITYFNVLRRMERKLREKTFMFSPFIRQGLYDSGPNEAFRITRHNGELKTFEQHMACKSLF